ncbi:unnamed protein product [Ilex paraguariensis]|uniref:Secreted protein n=1 Tax=Ilex paraguariensis TaxID=185542 RepID=A0ABC8TQC3_9AQUA
MVFLAVGAFIIVEMLFSSSLLAIVGAGEQPSLSPRRLCLFNTTTGTALRELNFLTSILAVPEPVPERQKVLGFDWFSYGCAQMWSEFRNPLECATDLENEASKLVVRCSQLGVLKVAV